MRLTGSERAQERAVREATCLAKLDHPNVVRYYQVCKEEAQPSPSPLTITLTLTLILPLPLTLTLNP